LKKKEKGKNGAATTSYLKVESWFEEWEDLEVVKGMNSDKVFEHDGFSMVFFFFSFSFKLSGM
jgi:hypothetical protein